MSIAIASPIANSTHLLTKCFICDELLNSAVVDCAVCKRSAHIECLSKEQRVRNGPWLCGLCVREQDKREKKDCASEKGSKRASKASSISVRKRRELLLKKLEEEKTLKLKELQLEKEFIEKKYKLLEENATSEDDDISIVEADVTKENVEDWLKKVDATNANKEEPEKSPEKADEVVKVPGTRLNPAAKPYNPTYQEPRLDHHCASGEKCGRILSKENLAARHETRSLPTFKGDFCDWPIFNSAFISTTSRCGFDNYENLSRLREALKGEARESVEALLTHEDNVPEIISTLKMLYGRKDHIIFSLIKKVKGAKNGKFDITNLL